MRAALGRLPIHTQRYTWRKFFAARVESTARPVYTLLSLGVAFPVVAKHKKAVVSLPGYAFIRSRANIYAPVRSRTPRAPHSSTSPLFLICIAVRGMRAGR